MLQPPGYEIGERIHEGPRSCVYRGRDLKEGHPVIIKVPARQVPTDEDRSRLRREFQIGSDLRDPHVVRHLDLVPFGQGLALIQEDFDAQALSKAMTGAGLPIPLALDISTQLSEALGALHRGGVIHKDVQPRNILLARLSSHLKITDFGIASRMRQENRPVTGPYGIEGSLPYVSPEQTGRMNRALDHRTDLYSLGVTLYELLCGAPPFETDDPMELVHSHMAKSPVPPRARRESIPESLSRIVLRLLEKNPESRYQSARGLWADLEKCRSSLEAGHEEATFPLGEHDFPERFRTPESVYGRERETGTLLTAFEQAGSGRPQVLLIRGPAGVGKSALVREIQKPATGRRGYFAAGKFDQINRDMAYGAIAQAFRSLVRQLLGETEGRIRAWREGILAAVGPNARIILDVVPEIRLIIGSPPPVPEVGPVESRNRFNLVFQSFVRFLTQPEHPLVLFLDDLQWADSASLNLLRLLAADPGIRHVLVIGAYRTEAVPPSHPATAAFEAVRQSGGEIHEIDLGPLDPRAVEQWLADTFRCRPDRPRHLADLVHRKTGGNPFSVKVFLQSLHDNGLLAFAPGAGWEWDMERIGRLHVTANVADLIVSRMASLPESSREMLKTAACLGEAFSPRTLAMVTGESPETILARLLPAVNGEMILKSADGFRFSHDRVQEAAYRLIPADRKEMTHLALGRVLLARTSGPERDESLFEIVEHLNKGRREIREPGERAEVARLNLQAGGRAKASTAYGPAMTYLSTGIEVLGESVTASARDLLFALCTERAECACLEGDFEESARMLDRAFEQCVSLHDQGRVYVLRILQKAMQSDYAGALALGVEALRPYGLCLPDPEDPAGVDRGLRNEMQTYHRHWEGRAVSELASLPVTQDPESEMIMSILSSCLDCAIIGAPHYLGLLAMTMTNDSIIRGNTSTSPFAYVWTAVMHSAGKNFETAWQFGEMALRLNEQRIRNRNITSKLLNMFGGFVAHLKLHFPERIPVLQRGYEAGMESGDLLYAGYNIVNKVRAGLLAGTPLDAFVRQTDQDLAVLDSAKNRAMYDLTRVFQGFALCLQGRTGGRTTLDHEDFAEEAFRRTHGAIAVMVSLLDFYKLKSCYLLEDYAAARRTLARTDLPPLEPQVEGIEFRFYGALTLLRTFPGGDGEERRGTEETVREYHALIHGLAEICPINYRSYDRILAGERARVEGRALEALDAFDEAVEAARAGGLVHMEALASELAGRLWIERGKDSLAGVYLARAHEGYSRWGARAKAQALATDHAHRLAMAGGTPPTRRADSPRAAAALDILSVLKVSRVISSEIEMETLLKRLMKILIENAGAQRGVLVLETEGEMRVEARAEAESDEVHVLLAGRLEGSGEVPATLVRTVLRTGEDIVLEDACEAGAFVQDPYVREKRPRSILCSPLRHKDTLLGVLYLENNLSADTFT